MELFIYSMNTTMNRDEWIVPITFYIKLSAGAPDDFFAAVVFHDSKVHGANMGPIWGRQDPGGPHVGPMNLAIWVAFYGDLFNFHWKPRVVMS